MSSIKQSTVSQSYKSALTNAQAFVSGGFATGDPVEMAITATLNEYKGRNVELPTGETVKLTPETIDVVLSTESDLIASDAMSLVNETLTNEEKAQYERALDLVNSVQERLTQTLKTALGEDFHKVRLAEDLTVSVSKRRKSRTNGSWDDGLYQIAPNKLGVLGGKQIRKTNGKWDLVGNWDNVNTDIDTNTYSNPFEQSSPKELVCGLHAANDYTGDKKVSLSMPNYVSLVDESEYTESELSTMTKANLVELAKDLELDTTGNKQDLIDRILESQ